MDTITHWLIALAMVAATALGAGVGTQGAAQMEDPRTQEHGGGGIPQPWPSSWYQGSDTKCVPDPKSEECTIISSLDDGDVKP